MAERKPRSLDEVIRRFLIGWVMLPFLAVLVSGGALFFFLERQQLEARQRETARSLAHAVEFYLEDASRVLIILSQLASYSSADTMKTYLQDTWEEYRYFETLYHIDEAGRIVLTVPASTHMLNLGAWTYFEQDQLGDWLKISTPFISPRTGHPIVLLARRITTGGMMVGEFDLGEVQEIISRTAKTRRTSLCFVTDRYGNVLAHPRSDWIAARKIDLTPFQSMPEGTAEITRIHGTKQGLVQTSAVRLKKTEWLVAVSSPLTSLYGSMIQTAVFALGVMLLVGAALLWALGRSMSRQVVTPLQQLGKRAEDLMAGRYPADLEFPPATFQELRDLEENFRCMSITIRQREEALRANEALFRALVQNTSDMISVLEADGTIRYRSPSSMAILGRDPDDYCGRSLFEDKHPEDVAKLRGWFAAISAAPGLHGPFTFRTRHADGSWVELEAIATNLQDDPAIGGIVCHSRNITRRKQAEKALIHAKETWERTFNAVSNPIIILDDQHRIIRANRATGAMFGMSTESLSGALCYKLFHNLSAPPDHCPHQRSMEDGREHTWDFFSQPLNAYYQVTTSPLRDAQGSLIGSVHVIQDITERKQVEEERGQLLRRVQQQQAALFEMSTHPAVAEGYLERALEVIVRVAAATLDVEWVHIGQMEADGFAETYCRSRKTHSTEPMFQEDMYRHLSDALEREPVLDIRDMAADPRASALSDWWQPLGITSALILATREEFFSIVAFARVGPARAWTPDEITFASQVSDIVTRTVLNAQIHERTEQLATLNVSLEETVRKRTFELETLYELSQQLSSTLNEEDLIRSAFEHIHRVVPGGMLAILLIGPHSSDIFFHNLPSLDPALRQQVTERLTAPYRHLEACEQPLFRDVWCECCTPEPPQPGTLRFFHDVTLAVDGRSMGHLVLGWAEEPSHSISEERFLTMLGRGIAEALDRLRSRIAAEQRHLENLLENLPEGVVLLDNDGSIVMANRMARAFLHALGVHSRVVDQLMDVPLAAVLETDIDSAHIELASADHRLFEVKSSRLKDIETSQWVLIIRDITEERRQREQIQQQDRLAAVGQLAAGIAHDFNNLLTSVMIQAQLLQMRTDDSRLAEGLGLIIAQGQRAAQLIQQILDFSRKSIIVSGSLDLGPFLKEMVKILRRIIEEHIVIVYEAQDEPYWVEADPTQMQQIVTNLAVNARDAMPDGGELRILVSRADYRSSRPPLPDMDASEWVVMTFRDTGKGISPEHLAHVFEPFFTTKEVGKGTGLGLSQVYGIVVQHRGHIEVKSAPGEGATFTIYLPAHPGKPNTLPEDDTGLDLARGRGETILLVEDEPQVLQIGHEMLEFLGYRVITAANGMEALQVYDQYSEEIALVITDMVMPEMGGRDLVRQLRERNRAARFLVVTGYPLEESASGLMQEGIEGWIGKPFSLEQLSAELQRILHPEEITEDTPAT